VVGHVAGQPFPLIDANDSGTIRTPPRLGLETPERECWYINMGAVDKAFFTTEAMVKMSEVGQM
jgi:hypothetical protein